MSASTLDDRAILIQAARKALQKYDALKSTATILGATRPGSDIMDPIAEAFEKTQAFRAVNGMTIFSGYGGPVITASRLTRDFLDMAGKSPEFAADWFLRLCATTHLDGRLIVVVWGVSVDREIKLDKRTKLVPFGHVPPSRQTERITSQAHSLWQDASWISEKYYDLPRAALVTMVPKFPYRGRGHHPAAFTKMAALIAESQDRWTLLQAVCAGRPLAFGYWFEYVDAALDICWWENPMLWGLPEILPRIGVCSELDTNAAAHIFKQVPKLPGDWRKDIMRSMKRFILSQCRHEMVDRIVDLALAFEVLFSAKGDSGPIGWRVGLRAAQLVGGELEVRKHNRNVISNLYRLRNKGAHGSSFSDLSADDVDKAVEAASDFYCQLAVRLIEHSARPDWDSIDLEPHNPGT